MRHSGEQRTRAGDPVGIDTLTFPRRCVYYAALPILEDFVDISPIQIAVVLISGLIAGFINTMAGGGSFLTIVALEFAGIGDITIANGTNRVAVEVGAILSTLGFKSKGVSNFRLGLHFAIPATFGSVVGAQIASTMPTDVFKRVLAVAMLMMLATLTVDTKGWLAKRKVTMTPRRRILAYLAFFGVGIYGGAIQAGVGFLLIGALVLLAGQDLVRTNFFKVFIVLIYTVIALVIFAVNGQVNWLLGCILAVGNGAGGWLTSRLMVDKGEGLVKVVLGVMLVVMSVRYLQIIPGF